MFNALTRKIVDPIIAPEIKTTYEAFLVHQIEGRRRRAAQGGTHPALERRLLSTTMTTSDWFDRVER